MFTVSEAEAAAIRAAFEQGGEFSAAVELRRLFPGSRTQCRGARVRPDHRRVEAAAGGYRPPLSTITQRLDRERTPTALPVGQMLTATGSVAAKFLALPPLPLRHRLERNRLIDDAGNQKAGTPV
jgi:hypothetical protein